MVRLARFKATDPHRGQMGYSGLPITVCASWVALFVYISQSEPRKQIPWLTEGPWAVLFLAGIMVFIVLQVSTVRYPKPSKKAVMYIPAVILVLLLFAPGPKLGLYAAVVLLVFGLGYIVLGPFYMKRMAGRNNGGNLPQPANGDQ
jgi:phosphatidylserine synthase